MTADTAANVVMGLFGLAVVGWACWMLTTDSRVTKSVREDERRFALDYLEQHTPK